MTPAEVAWENAKADIPEHDAQFEGALYEPDGNEWRFNLVTRKWHCQCEHCFAYPDEAEVLSYADLIFEHIVADWRPRAPGRHSETRHLDEPAENVVDLLARLRQFPTEDLDEKRAA